MTPQERQDRIGTIEQARKLLLRIADGFPLAAEYLVRDDPQQCRDTLARIQDGLLGLVSIMDMLRERMPA